MQTLMPSCGDCWDMTLLLLLLLVVVVALVAWVVVVVVVYQDCMVPVEVLDPSVDVVMVGLWVLARVMVMAVVVALVHSLVVAVVVAAIGCWMIVLYRCVTPLLPSVSPPSPVPST